MNWSKFIKNNLSKCKRKKLWRDRKVIKNHNKKEIIFNKKKYINFSSNDYLGLSNDKKIIEKGKKSLEKYGLGSKGSSYVTGYHDIHYELEKELSDWLGYPRAILYISGYIANQSVLTTLMNKNDIIVLDRLVHSSIIEGSLFSKAKLKRFPHNKINTLKNFFPKNFSGKILIITEGIFSMDGDLPPLNKMKNLTKQNKAKLMVDDAHGIGVLGKKGKGTCDTLNIKPDFLIVTFGKAFGLSGAALLCDNNTAEYILQFSKHLIYSTNMPPFQASLLYELIFKIKKSDHLRKKLKNNINYFRQLIKQYNLPFLNSKTQIQPLIIGDNKKTLELSYLLAQNGIWIQAIRPPSVPIGTSRLRITLTANHNSKDIKILFKILNKFFINKIKHND